MEQQFLRLRSLMIRSLAACFLISHGESQQSKKESGPVQNGESENSKQDAVKVIEDLVKQLEEHKE